MGRGRRHTAERGKGMGMSKEAATRGRERERERERESEFQADGQRETRVGGRSGEEGGRTGVVREMRTGRGAGECGNCRWDGTVGSREWRSGDNEELMERGGTSGGIWTG